jgi:LmbE family N-acetylglucosaminyl deacetylase
MKKFFWAAIILFVTFNQCSIIFAANQLVTEKSAGYRESGGIVALAQTLKDLTNPFSLACVATTLDDVDFATLAYSHQKFGARIAIILATRSEGAPDGAAASSNEDFAVEQTARILQAAQMIDADIYFLNLRDFGKTLSAEEALSNWGKAEAAKRLVQAIRWLRPDAIISKHDGKNGDGQQQALGRLLIEAFDSAADTKTATGADSEAWQVKRLFLKADLNLAEIIININEFDALRGKTYAETAAFAARTARQSFAQGVAAKTFYKLALTATGEEVRVGSSFFEGFILPEKLRLSVTPPIVSGLSLMQGLLAPEKLLAALTEKLIEKRAEGSAATLRERYGKEYFRVLRFTENLERAIALVLGIRCEMNLADKIVAQGETVKAQITFHNDGGNPLSMVFHTSATLPVAGKNTSYQTSETLSVLPYETVSQEITYETAKDAPITLPHFKHLYDERYYPASALRLSSEAFGNLLIAYAEINLGQMTITLPIMQRFDVAEPFEISVTPPFAFVKDWTQQRDVEFSVRIRKRLRGAFAGALWVVPMALQTDSYEPLPLQFTGEDEEALVKLQLRLPLMRPPLSPDVLLELRRQRPAAPVALASIKIPVKEIHCEVAKDLKVGYLAAVNSKLPLALAALAVDATALSVEEIGASRHGVSSGEAINQSCANLKAFETVIIDASLYSDDANLLAKNRCLLEYVRGGGNLVVLYQRPGFWSSLFNRNSFAPFSIKLSSEEIINKNGFFRLLKAEHPLLAKPNQLSAKDFEASAQSLALYLPQAWSSEYEALLEWSNGNDETQKGALLFTRYGEGSYVYASLNLPQQLTGLNAGAYRLFANFISLPKSLKEQTNK